MRGKIHYTGLWNVFDLHNLFWNQHNMFKFGQILFSFFRQKFFSTSKIFHSIRLFSFQLIHQIIEMDYLLYTLKKYFLHCLTVCFKILVNLISQNIKFLPTIKSIICANNWLNILNQMRRPRWKKTMDLTLSYLFCYYFSFVV